MDDLLERMRAEEAELQRKLEAVRLFLAAYGGGAAQAAAAPAKPARKIPSLAERMDRFGAYGSRVVGAAIGFLPSYGGEPMLTRELAERIQNAGIKITGENKVNSLSALLARSTMIKGYGRAGWTLAEHAVSLNENGAPEGAPDAEGVDAPSINDLDDPMSVLG